MAKIRTIQIYRGTKAQNDAYTGSAGELTMDTTNNELRLHDGSTVGGHGISGNIKNKNTAAGATNPIYDWVGTLAEYTSQSVATNHPDWVCYITDDLTAQAYDAYSKSQSDTLLANKANVDLDNLSATGKATGASLGMPSGTYDELTLGAAGSTYTAPANGYFVLIKKTTGVQYIGMYCLKDGETTLTATSHEYGVNGWTPTGGGINVFLPIKKGKIMAVDYNAAGATEYLRFVYAQGEQ